MVARWSVPHPRYAGPWEALLIRIGADDCSSGTSVRFGRVVQTQEVDSYVFTYTS